MKYILPKHLILFFIFIGFIYFPPIEAATNDAEANLIDTPSYYGKDPTSCPLGASVANLLVISDIITVSSNTFKINKVDSFHTHYVWQLTDTHITAQSKEEALLRVKNILDISYYTMYQSFLSTLVNIVLDPLGMHVGLVVCKYQGELGTVILTYQV